MTGLYANCNSRLLRSHMRLKKNRPYNYWLKSQGHYLLCFSTSKTVGANSVHLRHETRTRYSLKATTKIPPTLENKNVPILRSQNTQNTRTPLKTGSEQSVKLFFFGLWNFDSFQMDQPKTHLTSTYLSQNTLGKIKLGILPKSFSPQISLKSSLCSLGTVPRIFLDNLCE